MTESTITTALPAITCPQCKGPSSFAKSNRFRPFCSERCKLIDLGAWGNEDFRVPAQAPLQDVLHDSAHLPNTLD